jgi:hypothetical protein
VYQLLVKVFAWLALATLPGTTIHEYHRAA